MTTDPVVHQVANDPSVGIWIRYMLHGFAVAARILASVAWPLVVLLLLRKVKLSDLNSLLVNRDLAAIFGDFKVTATVPAAGAEKAPSPENEKETGLKERDARPKMMKEVPLSETAARIAPMIPEKSVMAGAPAPGTAITVNRAALLGKPGSVYYFAHDLMLERRCETEAGNSCERKLRPRNRSRRVALHPTAKPTRMAQLLRSSKLSLLQNQLPARLPSNPRLLLQERNPSHEHPSHAVPRKPYISRTGLGLRVQLAGDCFRKCIRFY